MNPRIMQSIAFALGCMLALQSASSGFAQSVPSGTGADPKQRVASTPAATSPPTPGQASGSDPDGGSQEASPNPEAPTPQTPDMKESLRVEQTKEAAKTQHPDSEELQQPQGTAAGQVQPTTGTAASQPAGAAIAPAKQRRSRSLLIRLGILAGAGIAVGTVVALSSASPSRPPGSK
jgi:hypothetical protein